MTRLASSPVTRRVVNAEIGALAVAIALAAFAIVKGTWAVGGSDSSCYALMADAFAHGEVQPATALALEAPWRDAARTFAPAGFIPSPVRRDAASPICAPGFSLLLSPFRMIGGRDAIFLATPLAAALLAYLAFVFGRQLATPLTGVAAAIVVATTPIVLFQATQPMNDITVAVLWLGVLVSASVPDPTRPWLMGALAGSATLVRPNLAPAGFVVFAWVAMMALKSARCTISGSARLRLLQRNVLAFVIACAPFLGVMVWLNAVLYGNPLQSGYGSARELFGLDNVLPNLRLYAGALLETHWGLPLLGLAALAPSVARFGRPAIILAFLVGAAVVAVYLPYQRFNEWWYLRFLLPTIVPMTVLAIVAGKQILVALVNAGSARFAFGCASALAIAWFSIDNAESHQAFDLQRFEDRFRQSGAVARERLPRPSAVITVWHSGTVRYHANQVSILWDSLDPSALDQAVEWLSSRGHEPFLIVESWEESAFRDRFAAHAKFGALDWPPRFDIARRVKIFKPSDRELYMQGGNIPTEFIR